MNGKLKEGVAILKKAVEDANHINERILRLKNRSEITASTAITPEALAIAKSVAAAISNRSLIGDIELEDKDIATKCMQDAINANNGKCVLDGIITIGSLYLREVGFILLSEAALGGIKTLVGFIGDKKSGK